MQPSPRAETSRLLFPSLRFFIVPPRQGNSLPNFQRKERFVVVIGVISRFHQQSRSERNRIDSYVGQRQKPQTREPSGRMMKSPVSGLNALQPPSSAATINRTSAPFLLSQNA